MTLGHWQLWTTSLFIIFISNLQVKSIHIFTTEHHIPTVVIYLDHHNNQEPHTTHNMHNTSPSSSITLKPQDQKTNSHKNKILLARLHHIQRPFFSKSKFNNQNHKYYQLKLVSHSSSIKHRTIKVSKLSHEDSVLLSSEENHRGFRAMIFNNQVSKILFKMTKDQNLTTTLIYSTKDYSTFLLITFQSSNDHNSDSIWIYGLIDGHMMIIPRFDFDHSNKTSNIHQIFLDKISHIHTLFESLDQRFQTKKQKDMSELLNQNLFYYWGQLLSKAPPKYQVYPEITLLIDYWTYKLLHQKNLELSWRYSLLFVQLLQLLFFKSISFDNDQFQIRLHLKQVLIFEDPMDFQQIKPSLEGFLAKRPDGNYLNALNALDQFGRWVYQDSQIETDLVLILTGQDLCLGNTDSNEDLNKTTVNHEYNSCSYSSVKGQAIIGGACHHRNKRLRRALNLAVVEDRYPLDGLHTMAHELGHLLGAVHDGEWPRSGLLGPGARNCLNHQHELDKYIMSMDHRSTQPQSIVGEHHKITNMKWSECSLEQFGHFFRQPQAICLLNEPTTTMTKLF